MQWGFPFLLSLSNHRHPDFLHPARELDLVRAYLCSSIRCIR